MARDMWRERERALEDEFFQKENAKILERMRAQKEHDRDLEALSKSCSVTDPRVLERLLELGVREENIAALAVAPLVAVAWADRRTTRKEREAVLEAAADFGVVPECPSYELLRSWLDDKPSRRLMEAWADVVRAVCERLEPEDRRRFAEDVIGRARHVARASGGVLESGVPITRDKRHVLDELEAAFLLDSQ